MFSNMAPSWEKLIVKKQPRPKKPTEPDSLRALASVSPELAAKAKTFSREYNYTLESTASTFLAAYRHGVDLGRARVKESHAGVSDEAHQAAKIAGMTIDEYLEFDSSRSD